MTEIDLKQADLNVCVADAQHDRVILTRNGKPIALIIGVEDMDADQLQLGSSDKFWQFISDRRKQKTISREQLEQKMKQKRI
jgi:antitoxin (DNA-binding transcriptional repressor) of toxin-antitoxin stability system